MTREREQLTDLWRVHMRIAREQYESAVAAFKETWPSDPARVTDERVRHASPNFLYACQPAGASGCSS